MVILIDESELDLYKYDIPCKCEYCDNIFYILKREARRIFKGTRNRRCCSRECTNAYKTLINNREISCKNCNKSIIKQLSKISSNNFCSKSCAAEFNNKHKTKGTRRSKLEIFLEAKLTEFYPILEFHFNRKDTINSELDIYIPSLKLGFELNGIFHYEPIYGKEKLSQITNNDSRKFQACIEKGIELCIIDVSRLSYFKEEKAQIYLDVIVNIISQKLEQVEGIEPP